MFSFMCDRLYPRLTAWNSLACSTHMILPPMLVSSLFRVVFIIWKVLAHPMIISTWILFDAFRLSRTTVSESSRLRPFNVVGVLLCRPYVFTGEYIYDHNNNSHVCQEKTCHPWVKWSFYDLSIARRSPVTGTAWRKTLGVMPIFFFSKIVLVPVRRKRHSLGITMYWPLYTELLSHPRLHVLRETFAEHYPGNVHIRHPD